MTTSVPFGSLLSKIIDNRGKTCPTSEAGIPLIATNCIKNEHLYPVYEKVRYVSQEVYDSWFRGHPEPGDLIFVLKGTPGRVNWVNNPVDFCIAQDMVALRVDENKVYPDAEAKALQKKEQETEQRAQAYQNCVDNAEIAYTSNWSSACQKLAERNQAALDNCLNNPSIINNQFMGKSYCEKVYGATEFDPECTLPGNTAEGIEKARSERKDACMVEAQQALY